LGLGLQLPNPGVGLKVTVFEIISLVRRQSILEAEVITESSILYVFDFFVAQYHLTPPTGTPAAAGNRLVRLAQMAGVPARSALPLLRFFSRKEKMNTM
jgi:hypothetical protein